MSASKLHERKAISKKLRFDVFKRDAFTCQYCGAHPPQAVLHVDHIVPVAEGGPTDIDNLATSCESCNLGKGARLLSSVPQSLAEKAVEVSEREEQLRGYHEIIETKRRRLEQECWKIVDELMGGPQESAPKDWMLSIRRFIESLGVHSVFEAAEIANAKGPYDDNKRFRYFCGICWNRIRDPE